MKKCIKCKDFISDDEIIIKENKYYCINCIFDIHFSKKGEKIIENNRKKDTKNAQIDNSNSLLDSLEKKENYTTTENQAVTYKSTLNSLLDFFSMGGALRTRSKREIIGLFTKAFAEDRLLALKMLFYFRDIRGGQGERKLFRTIINYLGDVYPKVVEKNLENISFYGRYDDYFALINTKLEQKMFDFLKKQIIKDIKSKHPSLLGKWMKSINTSSKKSRDIARKTIKAFGIKNEKIYRKILAYLREKIDVVERKLCAKQFKEIDYEKIPSNASLKYRNAFLENDYERYNQYLDDVKKEKKKIKTKTLFPYDILRATRNKYNETAELQWRNLPNYVEDIHDNWIVVCDTSGSMTGLSAWGSGKVRRSVEPILVSISLAIYFSERNQGPFKNRFITFSKKPQLQKIIGNTLYEKYWNLNNSFWDQNTDLVKVFELILYTAIANNVPESDMINKICIISDMEFDEACGNKHITNYERIQELYEHAGYKMPTLIFWNVESRQDQVPITVNQNNVYLVSGCSPSILKHIIKTTSVTPMEFMLEVLNSERYKRVVI